MLPKIRSQVITPLVVNLFAGPGSGKSTMASAIFSELKWDGVTCELALEYAKDKVWEQSVKVLDNQIYVFGKQHHRLARLAQKVDVIITDSPLLLSVVYATKLSDTFHQLVYEEFSKYNNLNCFIKRFKAYSSVGRLQTETEARQKDDEVLAVLRRFSVDFLEFPGTRESVGKIVDRVLSQLSDVVNLPLLRR